MGREIKRVPTDFDWPLDKIWKGYLNPYPYPWQECQACEGTGYNPETKQLSDDWYDFAGTGRKWCYNLTEVEIEALIEGNRLWDFTRRPINEEQQKIVEEKMANGGNSWLPHNNGYTPTPEEVNAWAKKGFGHDAINQMICVKARAKHLGVYGTCEHCGGEGEIQTLPDDSVRQYEAWESFEPPKGEEWQMWETVSEGSPVTPVLKSKNALINHLVNIGDNWGNKYTLEGAKKFAETGFALSGAVSNGQVKSGIDALGDL